MPDLATIIRANIAETRRNLAILRLQYDDVEGIPELVEAGNYIPEPHEEDTYALEGKLEIFTNCNRLIRELEELINLKYSNKYFLHALEQIFELKKYVDSSIFSLVDGQFTRYSVSSEEVVVKAVDVAGSIKNYVKQEEIKISLGNRRAYVKDVAKNLQLEEAAFFCELFLGPQELSESMQTMLDEAGGIFEGYIIPFCAARALKTAAYEVKNLQFPDIDEIAKVLNREFASKLEK